MHQITIPTSEGVFTALYSHRGLVQLDFPNRKFPQLVGSQNGASPNLSRWQKLTEAALHQALQGRTPKKLPPLDLHHATPFQRSVWQHLSSIPNGQVRTYTEVARAIRRPKAARAVGQACGANPIPVLVPCHRVLAANGKLGGFSGGLDWKTKLLGRESVVGSR